MAITLYIAKFPLEESHEELKEKVKEVTEPRIGKPDEGKPHVRMDEGVWETER
jgi:hypothetical protein